MTDSSLVPALDHARVESTNIGPVRSASFSVRPLTLFVGKNGAGKTLTSTLLYAIQKTIWSVSQDLSNAVSREVAQKYLNKDSNADDMHEIFLKHSSTSRFTKDLQEAFANEVRRAIGDPKVFIRHGSRIATFTVKHSSGWGFSAKFTSKNIVSEWSIPAIPKNQVLPEEGPVNFRKARKYIQESLEILFGSWVDRPTMIPAGRAGITDSYRYLAEQILLERHGYGKMGLSGVTRDFLATLVGSEHLPAFAFDEASLKLVSNLFDPLLGGSLRPSEELEELFVFEVGGHKVDKNVMSSMVKELGPMIILLQQGQLRGTALIVDEPECHLHPAAQIDLARILVSLISSDVRFVLSTHSPYLAQSLSNQWLMQSRKALVPEQSMAVAVFKDTSKGCVVRDAQFNPEFGFEFEEFVDAADKVQEDFVRLSI